MFPCDPVSTFFDGAALAQKVLIRSDIFEIARRVETRMSARVPEA